MNISKVLNDSLKFGKDVVWEKWVRWILLIFCTLFFPLLLGYEVEIYRGNKPVPDWCKLERFFIDGLKLLVIQIIYAIPTLIVLFATIGAGILAVRSPVGAMAMWGTFAVGIVIALIVAFITALIEMIGTVRFARTGSMGEAFNFTAILDRIGKIGWGSYIIALIVMFIVAGVVAFILALIPLIGLLLVIIAAPALRIFIAQYVALLYDSVPAQVPPAAPPAA
jgi:Protein of unknown function (DUF4013)